jgi:hypothetical protein
MSPKILTKAILLASLAFVFSCERDYDNPWDGKADLAPESWAPQNLAIEDVSITEKKLTWTYTGDNRFEGFKLDRKAGNAEWQEAYQVLPKEARNWTDSQVIPDPSLTYSYRVYAFAGKYNSAEKSSSATAEIPAPANVEIEKLTDKSYKINWADNSTGEQGFKIDRKIDNGNWVVAFGNVPANQISFTDTNVFRAVNVEYRVYAFLESHESLKIDVATTAELMAPTDLQIEKLTDKSYRLSWIDNSTGEQGFKIDRKIDQGNWVEVFGKVVENQTSFTDTNVFRAVNVEYRVYAFFESHESLKIEVATTAELLAPTDLQIEKLTDKSYRLIWIDNSTGEQGFKIDRKIDQGNWIEVFGKVAENQTSFTDTNVFRAVNVEYQVYAFIENHESSKVVTGTTAGLIAPTNLQIVSNSITSINLNWQDNSNGEDGFKMERKVEGGSWEPLSILPASITTFEDHAFELNTTVYYRVNAFVGQHNSSYAEMNFNSTIQPPSNLQITQNSITSVALTWQDNSNGESGFKLERKYEGSNWEQITVSTANNYLDNSFLLNTQVYYRVCSYVGLFNSIFTEKSFNSTIPPPTNLQITPNSLTSVTLSWQDNSNGEAGFIIDRKVNSGAWELNYGSVGHNQVSFNDNNLNWQANDYVYRVHSFFGQYNSATIESTVSWPVVSTLTVTNITYNSATSGGNITIQGNYNINARGVCYGTNQNPDLSSSHTLNSSGAGLFSSNISGLNSLTTYYVRAYATTNYGTTYGNQESFTTGLCDSYLTINHVAGVVAPVTKTVVYGTVKNIPGETSKCWITKNLGASQQATAVSDANESSAGWYWQFNRKQGYKHDGTIRSPNTTWITSINENSNWTSAKDPCTIELGNGWRIPTQTEWANVDAGGNWTNWNGPWNSDLKLHATGFLKFTDGSLYFRGSYGYYWGNSQYNAINGWYLFFSSAGSGMINYEKSYGFSLRCLRE